jgi:zinc transporter, ZIP family
MNTTSPMTTYSYPTGAVRGIDLQAPRQNQWPWRRVTGLMIVLAGTVISLASLIKGARLWTAPMQNALLGGLMAASATALGTLPVLMSRKFSQKTYDALLGFGAGVMLAASAFSLIIPALASARQLGASRWGAGSTVGAGILLGAGLLLVIDRLVPHEHFVKGLEGPQARALKRVWLFVLAISPHNLHEGLAIGVAFAGADPVGALALATGISIQDVPEGMVVALALRGVGYDRWLSAGMGVLSGLVEPLAAVLGVAVISLSASLLPLGLAVAAGAMLFVISHEIIPESHRQGHEAFATVGLILGFVVMMVLDTALG